MSSQAPPFQSSATRNPRRRQRNIAEDGSIRQQPQRKRNKISGESFKPASVIHLNGDAHKLNGHAVGELDVHSSPHPPLNMPVRGKQLATLSRRGVKDDGSITLVSMEDGTMLQA